METQNYVVVILDHIGLCKKFKSQGYYFVQNAFYCSLNACYSLCFGSGKNLIEMWMRKLVYLVLCFICLTYKLMVLTIKTD